VIPPTNSGRTSIGYLPKTERAICHRRGSRSWFFVRVLVAAALSTTGCGKVGAPVPPTRLSERTSELAAIQRGGTILLTWPVPALVADQSSRLFISRVDIYRLTESRNQDPVLDPEDFADTAQIVAVLDRTAIEAQAKAPGHLQYVDPVNLSSIAQQPNTRLRYAIRYVNQRGQYGTFSNTVAIEPASGVAMPPADVAAKADSQDSITISWSSPNANVNGAKPASVVGYNVYRRNAKRPYVEDLLNGEPLTTTSFVDMKFQYQVEYVYTVRSLSQGANGLIESVDSEPFRFTPVDTFAPAPPDPVSIASSNGTISLFWPSSSERDVIGYYVYRATSSDTPDKDWTRMNDQPLTPVTFRDDLVVIDQTYYYRVTAVDRFNNESGRSRVVSETAHP
jgi:hypothetical protein